MFLAIQWPKVTELVNRLEVPGPMPADCCIGWTGGSELRQSKTEERTAFQRSIGQPRRDRGGAEIDRVGRGGTNVVAGTRCACRPYCLSAWPLAFPGFDSTPSHCRMSQGESHWNSFSGSLYYNPSGAYHRELHFWLFLRLDIWKLETLPKQLVIDQFVIEG